MPEDDPDADLMPRIAEGDPVAYRALVDRHTDRLLAFAERLVGDRASAEDVVQDAYLAVWRTAARWTPAAKVSTWMYRIARNAALDRLRRRRPTVDPETVVLVDTADQADRQISARQTSAAVREALDTLPERQRTAIVLVHYEQRSGAEAADVLGVSVEALESLLARGRRALRAALEGQRADLIGGEP
ncbi:RNA polymerase sigma factor [Thalassobaculum sp.]|uniref:RNA polymerase sigma factor n=1 Tax=Thalassobaculum sp. TaxID=2022740 RepID=UPI0032ED1A37